MPPAIPPVEPPSTPQHQTRIICYHQTHYHEDKFVSIKPLLEKECGITHVIIAAIHLNESPTDITLNDDHYTHEKFHQLWEEVKELQNNGIKVLGMLGGAAKGSYARLDGTSASFEEYYATLKGMIEFSRFDGLDLDVEEPMSLAGVIRLIDRLKQDFGERFIITLAPVATALQKYRPHLSGFSYFELEKAFGRHISWYNTQFYCGWGSLDTIEDYDTVISSGWDPKKVVAGVVTNSCNGTGWLPDDILCDTLSSLLDRYGGKFGGVMGWEYFNSTTTSNPEDGPWNWSKLMAMMLRPEVFV